MKATLSNSPFSSYGGNSPLYQIPPRSINKKASIAKLLQSIWVVGAICHPARYAIALQIKALHYFVVTEKGRDRTPHPAVQFLHLVQKRV
ncbi:hypothetical protein ACE1AT_01170 [Pelatocladus sp. BLCC-F211]|uniref:hypothetical protein n=1 Tax=Pelatocladus sp. BLCC-F211 TaxID=3342752 RepID=UPI0035B80C3B